MLASPSSLDCIDHTRETCVRPHSLVADQLQKANNLFRQVWARGSLFQLWSGLTHQNAQLLDLSAMKHCHRFESAASYGVKAVPVDRIRGSENRSRDFDAHFYPTRPEDRERWVNIAKLILLHVDLQAVSLIQVGEVYFVRDGHHRVSVARALGVKYIDADVTQWRTQDDPIVGELLPISCQWINQSGVYAK